MSAESDARLLILRCMAELSLFLAANYQNYFGQYLKTKIAKKNLKFFNLVEDFITLWVLKKIFSLKSSLFRLIQNELFMPQ